MYERAYYLRNKKARDEISRLEYQNLRAEVLKAYGSKCVCCGEATSEFLSIDHIHSDGAYDRRVLKLTGSSMYRKLRREGFPKDRFQLLCHNCNQAKGYYGICPHQRDSGILG